MTISDRLTSKILEVSDKKRKEKKRTKFDDMKRINVGIKKKKK